MSDDLVKSHIEWLRGDHEGCNPVLADRIEALEARAAKAEAERDEAIIALKKGQTIPAAWYEKLRVERDALREALREAQEFLSNLNEDEPRRKMPAVQASAMCIDIERKARAALKETDT